LLFAKPAKLGRPPIPPELQALIHQMSRDNLTWGQKRIANELLLKLGLQVSPRTVRKYMPKVVERGPDQRMPAQRWSTFIRGTRALEHGRQPLGLVMELILGLRA
jgi:hypothetical protein